MSCIFCDVADVKIISQNEYARAIIDEFPVNRGHALIVPKRHIEDFEELTDNEILDIMSLTKEVKKIIGDIFGVDGYNFGVNLGEHAGQTVKHLHFHLIPRFEGDVDDPTGGIRGVIPHRQKY